MKTQRVLVLVDQANLTMTAKGFGRWVDWEKLRDYLANEDEGRTLVEMVLYIGMPPTSPEFNQKEDFLDKQVYWLEQHGFMVVTRTGIPTTGGAFKSNVDVVMAIDAMTLADSTLPDVVVLVTGDSDFDHLAHTLRRKGIRVEVAGIEASMSNALRRAANSYLDLTEVINGFPAIGGGSAPPMGGQGLFDAPARRW